MFDKLLHSKLNPIADWIIRVIMINILVIFCSLPIFTIYASLSAGYNVFNDYLNEKDVKLFRGFFQYYKTHIIRKIGFQILIMIVFVIGYINIRYYTTTLEQQTSVFLTIGYYITLAFIAVAYAVVNMSFVIMKTNPALPYVRLIKLSFFLSGKYYFRTLLIVLVNSIPLILLFFPQTMVFFIFMGIAIPLVIIAVITKDIVFYVEHLGDKK